MKMRRLITNDKRPFFNKAKDLLFSDKQVTSRC